VLEAEGAYVVPARADARIPGDGGTLLHLARDFGAEGRGCYRIRGIVTFSDRHSTGVLVAPLQLTATGKIAQDVRFNERVFPADTQIEGTYKFNSYRLFYRNRLYRSERLNLELGATAKIRDATIRVEGGGFSEESNNVGFVPLLSFCVTWQPHRLWDVVLDGDALAAPQGRAEDVLLAARGKLSDHVSAYGGYRVVEGGADNDAVYTFAWFNYAVMGVQYRF
jgi:hypothetical protein